MTVDDAIVEAAMAGNAPAIHCLLSNSRADLKRYARHHCQSADVEDAVQDALWIIFLRVSTLRAAGAFTAWSFRIVRRICYKLTREERFRDLAPPPEPYAAPTQETRLAVADALAQLPVHYREVLILKDVIGHSAADVAAHLGVPLEAAKARLHRARLMMREGLSGTSVETVRGLR
ncbi:MAG: RNA polymerase sigma factor [Asticcacaulis sp.]|nr:RNA polymerase sigma factor [Asticcacaulis sp.]